MLFLLKVLVHVTPCSTCPIILYEELGSAKQTWSILILVQHFDLFVSRSCVYVHFVLRVFLCRCSQLTNSHSQTASTVVWYMVDTVSGVRHRSVLGPFLFILYSACMLSILENQMHGGPWVWSSVNSSNSREAVAKSLYRDFVGIKIMPTGWNDSYTVMHCCFCCFSIPSSWFDWRCIGSVPSTAKCWCDIWCQTNGRRHHDLKITQCHLMLHLMYLQHVLTIQSQPNLKKLWMYMKFWKRFFNSVTI